MAIFAILNHSRYYHARTECVLLNISIYCSTEQKITYYYTNILYYTYIIL